MEFPRIRDLREGHDKSQRQIANMLHMQRAVYVRCKSGVREAPSWVAIKLAEYYHVGTDDLFGLTNDPRPRERRRR